MRAGARGLHGLGISSGIRSPPITIASRGLPSIRGQRSLVVHRRKAGCADEQRSLGVGAAWDSNRVPPMSHPQPGANPQ
jgi:hypothetical protein